MKYLIVVIFLAMVLESMIVVGQQLNSDQDNGKPSAGLNADNDGTIVAYKRPTGNFNGRSRKVVKVRKEKESLPVDSRSNSEDSVSASSNKNTFTVNNYDDDNDDYYSRRRARFLFRQRVGK